MAVSYLLNFIFKSTDFSSGTHSNFPSWRSLSSACVVFWVSVLLMLHVSSHWYFSAQHAASVSMLLSICLWLIACLCEQSKRCRVSLNKLMGSFIFGVPLFWGNFLGNFWKYRSIVFAEELYTVGPRFQEQHFNTEQQRRLLNKLCSNLEISYSRRFYSWCCVDGVKTHYFEHKSYTNAM